MALYSTFAVPRTFITSLCFLAVGATKLGPNMYDTVSQSIPKIMRECLVFCVNYRIGLIEQRASVSREMFRFPVSRTKRDPQNSLQTL
jgi:hypothetical protein